MIILSISLALLGDTSYMPTFRDRHRIYLLPLFLESFRSLKLFRFLETLETLKVFRKVKIVYVFGLFFFDIMF
jgi:hypothetical protein